MLPLAVDAACGVGFLHFENTDCLDPTSIMFQQKIQKSADDPMRCSVALIHDATGQSPSFRVPGDVQHAPGTSLGTGSASFSLGSVL